MELPWEGAETGAQAAEEAGVHVEAGVHAAEEAGAQGFDSDNSCASLSGFETLSDSSEDSDDDEELQPFTNVPVDLYNFQPQ